MGLVTWTSKMSVGIATIDKEHQGLFDIMNRLHDGMLTGHAKDLLGKILDELAGYTRTHFGNEEALLRKHGYPDLAAHIRLHQGFTTKVDDLGSKLKSGAPALAIPALDFLREWLVKHIQGVDFQYKPFLAAKGAK